MLQLLSRVAGRPYYINTALLSMEQHPYFKLYNLFYY